MNIVGKSIMHIRFGKGIIVNQYDNKMEVDFGSCVKCFLYPAAFENFFKTLDAETEKFINKELEIFNKIKKKSEYEKEVMNYKLAFKNRQGFHGIFDVREEELSFSGDSWKISTSSNNKKDANGEIIIPKKLNMNSVCILTMKEKGKKESERKVIGLFMTEDDFIGMNCLSGIITAHEKYRILLDCDEPIYFWNFFSEDKRLKSWGSRKMKYLSTVVVEQILNRIFAMDTDDDLKEEMIEFNRYFSEINYI